MTKTVEAGRVLNMIRDNKDLIAKFHPARTFEKNIA